MPQFYFHLRDGSDELLDPDGVDLADSEAMKRSAMEAARGVMAADIANGVLDLRYRIDVENSERLLVYSLAFRHAVSVIAPMTEAEAKTAASLASTIHDGQDRAAGLGTLG